jgi:hypothetical protein
MTSQWAHIYASAIGEEYSLQMSGIHAADLSLSIDRTLAVLIYGPIGVYQDSPRGCAARYAVKRVALLKPLCCHLVILPSPLNYAARYASTLGG